MSNGGMQSELSREGSQFDCRLDGAESDSLFAVETTPLTEGPIHSTELHLHQMSFVDHCEEEECSAGNCRAAVSQSDHLWAIEAFGLFWPVSYIRNYVEMNGPQWNELHFASLQTGALDQFSETSAYGHTWDISRQIAANRSEPAGCGWTKVGRWREGDFVPKSVDIDV